MRTFHLASVLLATLVGPAAAQVIPIRTAPIMRADGFEILPSRANGMGGVSIALTDSLDVSWANPAAGARVTGVRLFGSAVAYDVSSDAGRGVAVPVGVVARRGDWFGAGAVALQSVKPPGSPLGFVGAPPPGTVDGNPASGRGSEYGFGMLGRSWSEVSLGGSVLVARRSAVDGLDQMYGPSLSVDPSGRLTVVRIGVLWEWAGARSLEAVAVHSRTRMTHDVTYFDGYWDPETQQAIFAPREERNADEADVWGVHLAHARTLAAGWRIGWLLTGNRITYPSVPRYDNPRDGVMDIEAGRGTAHAFNLGLGLARSDGPVRLGIDVIFEPVWSRIWGEAEDATTTVENRLRFSNAIVRLGAGREWSLDGDDTVLDAGVGLATRVVGFRLAQFDYRQAAGRDVDERWVEWMPGWGAGLRTGAVEVRYHGTVARGTKRPAPAPTGPACTGLCLAGLSVVPGPGPGPLTELRHVGIVTQQVFVSYRLGNSRRGGGGS